MSSIFEADSIWKLSWHDIGDEPFALLPPYLMGDFLCLLSLADVLALTEVSKATRKVVWAITPATILMQAMLVDGRLCSKHMPNQNAPVDVAWKNVRQVTDLIWLKRSATVEFCDVKRPCKPVHDTPMYNLTTFHQTRCCKRHWLMSVDERRAYLSSTCQSFGIIINVGSASHELCQQWIHCPQLCSVSELMAMLYNQTWHPVGMHAGARHHLETSTVRVKFESNLTWMDAAQVARSKWNADMDMLTSLTGAPRYRDEDDLLFMTDAH